MFQIYYLSERAVTIEFGNEINVHLSQQISSFDQFIYQHPFPGFMTTVPAYTTLTVFFDPLIVIQVPDLAGTNCFDKVCGYLTKLNHQKKDTVVSKERTITIPVCYGNELGPDMDEVSHFHQLSVPEIIDLHCSAIYKVYMIGFIPGFAYMGGMTDRLSMPRKATPRQAVPAGSVGIAGQQTGVYPLEVPGGWQIIGQTPFKLFDASQTQPSLLKAGDQVIFTSIGLKEFNDLSNK